MTEQDGAMEGSTTQEETFPTLSIPWAAITISEWAVLGHWGQRRLWETLYPAIVAAVNISSIRSLPIPCNVFTEVHLHNRARWSAKTKRYSNYAKKGDPQNRLVAIDKVIIDSLTEPRGRKTRGLGLLPDDSSKYVTLMVPDMYLGAPDDKTVLTFKPREHGTTN